MTYCSEILKQKENEIKQLKKENQDTVRCLNSVDDELQALKKQVEAAKQYIIEEMTCNCGECWTTDKQNLINIFSEGFSAEKSSLGETTKCEK